MAQKKLNSTKFIEFPFRMNWIAAVHGGEIVLELFWDVVRAMNDIAIKGDSITKTDIENIEYLNDIFKNWDLPVFLVDGIDVYCPSVPCDKVLPFPA
jgi:hypothetical protein